MTLLSKLLAKTVRGLHISGTNLWYIFPSLILFYETFSNNHEIKDKMQQKLKKWYRLYSVGTGVILASYWYYQNICIISVIENNLDSIYPIITVDYKLKLQFATIGVLSLIHSFLGNNLKLKLKLNTFIYLLMTPIYLLP